MSFPTTHAALARALTARGYTVPTAVQLAVLEVDEPDSDLLVSAQTGSGKTVAFGLSMAPTLLGDAERMGEATAPSALIIAPTRELAMQVCRELTWLYEGTGARIITCVGGMDVRAEARQLRAGAHIVVGTPGRLRDHLERKRIDLSELKVAVLDEADEMLNLGFREDLEFILETVPTERRTLLFSATLPREIEALARRYQRDAKRIQTIGRDEQHVDIDYVAHRVAPRDVESAVVNVLRYNEAGSALVFCSTREAVNRFCSRLVGRGFSAVALSGELTQQERTQALQSLRDGRARVLVATDVAARGLDLPDLALVIHADLPNDAETLLHRSGRTGRAGRKGRCVLIVPFSRRRKADMLINGARLKVTWDAAPTPHEIRARDQERFLAHQSFTDDASEDETASVAALQAGRTADEIALALVRLHDARLPTPDELAIDAGPPRREGRHGDRDTHGRGKPKPAHKQGAGSGTGPREPKHRRDDGREMVWFKVNIGRERNADPRWLLPLICRAGDVTKSDVGAIRIEDNNTRFQIAAESADQFDHVVRSSKNKEGQIVRLDERAAASSAPRPVEESKPESVKPAYVPKNAPDGAASPRAKKKGGKPGGRPAGKAKSGGWTPRQREDRGAGSKGKKRPGGRAARADAGTQAKAAPFAKKKRVKPQV